MKTFALRAWFLAALPMVLLTREAAIAQVPATGAPTGINAAFVKLFGALSAFTARVETQVTDPSQKELVRMPMEFAALDGKVRLEIDLAQAQSKELTASALAGMKQSGMDRVVSIFRPDKKITYIIYPGVQSYLVLPLAKGDVEALEQGLTLKKSALGKETVDGHPCVKNKVTVSNAKGSVLEAITWNAVDLKDFPLQVQMNQKDNKVIMRFSQVRLVKPDAKQFDLPPNYGQMQ
jgi:hypothetical protein